MAPDSPSDGIGQMLRLVASDLGGWISDLDAWPSDVPLDRRSDPQQQFKVLLDGWHGTFRYHLTGKERSYVFELKDIRNRWAHHDPFSADDVWRALDTGERLMRAIGSDETADALSRSKRIASTSANESGSEARSSIEPVGSHVADPALGGTRGQRPTARRSSPGGLWFQSMSASDQAKLDRFQSWLEQVEHKSAGTASDYKSYVALLVVGGEQALGSQSPKRRSSIRSGARAYQRYVETYPADKINGVNLHV